MSKVDRFDDEIRPEYEDWSDGVRGKYAGRRPPNHVTVAIEVIRMPDGRWRARAPEFPEAIGYGDDADTALDQSEERIGELFEGRVGRGEIPPTALNFSIDYR